MNLKFIFCFLSLFLLIALSACTPAGPGMFDTFAQCLTDNGATMYGTEWCSHCKNQKEAFGSSFKNINYVDCDYNKEECANNGVKGYPTWKINDELFVGEQSLPTLARETGCELIEDGLEE